MTFVKQNPWNAVDRTNLMQFLASDTGVKLLELIGTVESPRPRSMSNSTIESFAIQSARFSGWLDVCDYIETMVMRDPSKVGTSVEWFQEEQTDPRERRPNPL